MELATAPSQLDRSIAADEIDPQKQCTSCGRECEGVVLVAGIDRICSACFRGKKYMIVRGEHDMIPRYHRGKSRN